MSDPSGSGAETRVVLLVGTQKGLFRVQSDGVRAHWTLEGPFIPGCEITHAWLDPRDRGKGYAAGNHSVWGSHVYATEDGARTWTWLARSPHHEPTPEGPGVKSLWYLAAGDPGDARILYAGIDPPGLFVSRDAGGHWEPVHGLNEHPTRGAWEPSRGIFAVHSIHVDPTGAERVYAAVSAGGAFRSEDAGVSWTPINRGVRAENLPEPAPESGHNIHRLHMPSLRPERLYRQCYNGTYRSDDRGETWTEITAGLPSDFGYVIDTDPNDPDTVFVIPEEGSHMRAPVQGKLRVYRSRDAGGHWEPLTDGLPQAHVYVTVLREALATDGLRPSGVYFGTSGGHLFASADGGDRWQQIAGFLPRVLSISACVLPEA
ncbi:MAG: hypothetical protein GWN84_05605 [Gammaproteobacteria bacterium]|nr:hypothetical protein [Gammaproteobacteria bacterium]NIR82453.1 hypothetical protein [Gammaproteobacteria bacterium]NIR88449.1 hypothetical protein [Gammaproteobacteria bacterium]NIU03589.1 hypothetical protein [Gammaproteobacteria bacterium]NIV50941.1 hypothetical protein [Gammaproteobacteria bacterium]